jgi:hypothetical protein
LEEEEDETGSPSKTEGIKRYLGAQKSKERQDEIFGLKASKNRKSKRINLAEPVAVQALTRKLEQSLKQIEQEVELLAGQVEQQDEAIQTTVKKVAKEYMIQRIQELQMEIAGEGTFNQRADPGEEYMVEDSDIGQY